MKRSELRQIIKEEIKRLNEADDGFDKLKDIFKEWKKIINKSVNDKEFEYTVKLTMRVPFHYAKVFDWDPRMEPFYHGDITKKHANDIIKGVQSQLNEARTNPDPLWLMWYTLYGLKRINSRARKLFDELETLMIDWGMSASNLEYRKKDFDKERNSLIKYIKAGNPGYSGRTKGPLSFKEFRDQKPDINSPYRGETAVYTYGLNFKSPEYDQQFNYLKDGKKDASGKEVVSMEDAYKAYLEQMKKGQDLPPTKRNRFELKLVR